MPAKILYLLFLIAYLPCTAQVIRGDSGSRAIALVFTGDEFADGGEFILQTLTQKKAAASFFLTGNFYRNKSFEPLIRNLSKNRHYLGSHSDKHLLYCDWTKRDSLLVTRDEFTADLHRSYDELRRFDIQKEDAHYFLPPFEWYNDSIVRWCADEGLQLVNFTPGTRSTADYTTPDMGNRYTSSKAIYQSILDYEKTSPSGLNGFILLLHIGTHPGRKDKFYHLLPALIDELKGKGYRFVRIDELLNP